MTANLYTGKGDDGTTKFFGCDQKRVSKNSSVAEALGSLDELNSFLGFVKVEAEKVDYEIDDTNFAQIIETLQQNIFIICANIAGADKLFGQEKSKYLEGVISVCENELEPIKTFKIAGGTELSARLDYARTLARRAERGVVSINDELGNIDPEILKYMNRLSSVLFALARTANKRSGVNEKAPNYE